MTEREHLQAAFQAALRGDMAARDRHLNAIGRRKTRPRGRRAGKQEIVVNLVELPDGTYVPEK